MLLKTILVCTLLSTQLKANGTQSKATPVLVRFGANADPLNTVAQLIVRTHDAVRSSRRVPGVAQVRYLPGPQRAVTRYLSRPQNAQRRWIAITIAAGLAAAITGIILVYEMMLGSVEQVPNGDDRGMPVPTSR